MGKLFLFLLSLSAGAELIFEKSTQSITVSPEKKSIALIFPFTVSGDTELTKIDAHCSCSEAKISDGKSSWKDGEKGSVNLTIDVTQLRGDSKKSISLLFKDAPTQKLYVDVSVPVAISVTPRNQKWKVGQEPETKQFTITIAKGFDFNISNITLSNSDFDFDLKPVPIEEGEESRSFLLSVTPQSYAEKQFCLFKINTDSDIERYKSCSAMAIIQ